MPHKAHGCGSPDDWLRHAQSDLALARAGRAQGVLLGDLCFHLQQCVEKCLKAVLVQCHVSFPYTHNIAVLITLLRKSKSKWPKKLDRCAELTDYAVRTRYPGETNPITVVEYQQALTIAGKVLAWATTAIYANARSNTDLK
ncbi:MAG: HEPN domain-containing protein [Kiritimatiellae bacterium]|nr:HEPN domain-containing protein [Verrucomicrobiota bacterium]MBU4285746.1 HEPN domain-containing protein [Verrucomicrobiota bacterium]MBU4365767.1 HEPN domain-containing protein [Verrucomicrobiota bacterium]MCG2658719.1 HEPN domain-containing protein [Kiritimatiellia bacterium]